MSTATLKRTYTVEEYLARELVSRDKHEFYRGEIFMMAGGRSEHSILKVNLVRLIGNKLAGKEYTAFDSDMRVKVTANGLYTYPDASIACPPIAIETKNGCQSLLNPVVLFEVLSSSTANYDRGAKFNLYSELESLKEYFLISQDDAVVERRFKTDSGTWAVEVITALDSSIRIASIEYGLPLRELYDKVEFPTHVEQDIPPEKMF